MVYLLYLINIILPITIVTGKPAIIPKLKI